jgi:uncharacterized membrane protein YraQ (UPF0718 family)/YHS domain-containing protein
VTHLLAALWLDDVGRGLREGFFMFWETVWALVLGFTLSGAVQAFVSKEAMQRSLGDHRAKAVAKAAGYGMVSSSCSYAASAMAKSLFKKGADLVSAMVFMLASTNLVVELGIVILILLGWQFTAGEFVGGPIMIALVALLGGVVLRGPIVERARRRLEAGEAHDGHDHGTVGPSKERQEELEHGPWSRRLGSRANWADAASYSVADLKMLRRELVIGYTVAGFLAALVPTAWWDALFVHGHGFWTSLENALVGPVIAVLSWVCSIGNVPLAAALWRGGISFGGVIAFIFADLIAMPLIFIYRKYYGTGLTLRLVALFYVVMAGAGLAVEGIFSVAGIVPHVSPHHQIVATSFSWDYTSYLNVIALVAAGGLYWLYRNRERLGGGTGLALDPVCGMQVRSADAPARTRYHGRMLYFCCDRCLERFTADPDRFIRPAGTASGAEDSSGLDQTGDHTPGDPTPMRPRTG